MAKNNRFQISYQFQHWYVLIKKTCPALIKNLSNVSVITRTQECAMQTQK